MKSNHYSGWSSIHERNEIDVYSAKMIVREGRYGWKNGSSKRQGCFKCLKVGHVIKNVLAKNFEYETVSKWWYIYYLIWN